MIRLEKYLVQCGVGSRKVIKALVNEGHVKINDETIYNYGLMVYPDKDKITFRDKPLKYKELKYYVMYKKAGYITAMKSELNKPVIAELLPEYIDKNSIFPVGRLDRDTEGLIIFTNDGEFNRLLTRPEDKIEKTYYAELIKDISTTDILNLEKGVTFKDEIDYCPGKVQFINSRAILLTITEGKYHQVKRMLRCVNNKVIYLKRVKFGKLSLDNMIPGEIKEIQKEDIID
ncbi:16S rRNA pseudouridine516 synthase [Cetobacterium ceti]|uniref:Pseudouridine synthase n=1 Tax=Cetobacterium ceti TaxID=180163 RepID=A0A1T4PH45_9FUSO|nr:pseudouridine synthase [Cetobacterium ceti]SJZ90842.1 16S rRNA pseudouridine516 synthase [Cetobacterium ceti]